MDLYAGNSKINQEPKEVNGCYVTVEGEEYYMIENFDRMQPFFMTVVSNSDLWMYISSLGSLSAGRANPSNAIFPYYTDDKIHDMADVTGSKTLVIATIKDKRFLWEPFMLNNIDIYQIKRRLYKNVVGNKLIFEELNLDLGISFSYSWVAGEKFGWVRKSKVENIGKAALSIQVVDGIRNILPYGVDRNMQGMLSTLVDAYKSNELVEGSTLALYRLSSIPVDKAEPSEALKATTVWSVGVENPLILLTVNQLNNFRKGLDLVPEISKNGIKGAYFIHFNETLLPRKQKKWFIIADVCKDSSAVYEIQRFIRSSSILNDIFVDIEEATLKLTNLVFSSDGFQLSSDRLIAGRHFSNVLFNVMRGGLPANEYVVEKTDFFRFIKHFNIEVFHNELQWLNGLSELMSYPKLTELTENHENPHLTRLAYEYLPLVFSRRHGDPSRPWNAFDIKLKNSDGTYSLNYQGNWRDIFQNWEALAMSFPAFLPAFISKFVNASTIDGYNPYKVTRNGFDWEIMDPSDPWSNIGYWGDHQIIYLTKLLELSEKFFPGMLSEWVNKQIFTYADVPYRIKPYSELLTDPQNSILFDENRQAETTKRVSEKGADGKLLHNEKGIVRASFSEKLMLPVLTKLSNFIPGAGIWMNTQRPEWNDANNALVGHGASMVTVYQLRRYIRFLQNYFKLVTSESALFHKDVARFLTDLLDVIDETKPIFASTLNDKQRKAVTDKFGQAGSTYREKVYSGISNEKEFLSVQTIHSFLDKLLSIMDKTIYENIRHDGLFNAYNLIDISDKAISINYLDEMLEGQVAIISSGCLRANEVFDLLYKLKNSILYRSDQQSYMLYPFKTLPGFLEKNNPDKNRIFQSGLLVKMICDGDHSIVIKDIQGNYHFNGKLNNSKALEFELEKLKARYGKLIDQEMGLILEIYEETFHHRSFTGRSGTFYKYEGLGCIYWHMVSKLLLAVAEIIDEAAKTSVDPVLISKLKDMYQEIKQGIGVHKNPEQYGAFPTDPYSHTPSFSGVQQPGMTGQVKEDILSRFIELGIRINKGILSFDPVLLNANEFLRFNNDDNMRISKLYGSTLDDCENPSFCFTFCGIPVIYQISEVQRVEVVYENSTFKSYQLELSPELSRSVFLREKLIKSIKVSFSKLHN
jgi:hypothetical protein